MISKGRTWFRFSLRTILVLTTALCLYLGARVKQAHDQKKAIAAIDALGGTYGVYVEGPEWLRNLVGDDELFYNAARVSFGPGNQGYDPNRPFGDNELRDVISQLNEFSKFRSLYLGSSQVTDAGLSHLQRLHNIERLSLAGTRVSDKGIEHLMSIGTLRYVDLRGSKVSSDGLQRLQKALPEREVELGD